MKIFTYVSGMTTGPRAEQWWRWQGCSGGLAMVWVFMVIELNSEGNVYTVTYRDSIMTMFLTVVERLTARYVCTFPCRGSRTMMMLTEGKLKSYWCYCKELVNGRGENVYECTGHAPHSLLGRLELYLTNRTKGWLDTWALYYNNCNVCLYCNNCNDIVIKLDLISNYFNLGTVAVWQKVLGD